MSDNLFQALLAEAEAKRADQEAHAAAVKAAKHAELIEMTKGIDKSLRGAPKGFKPVRAVTTGYPRGGVQMAACKRQGELIAKLMGEGKTYEEVAIAVSDAENIPISKAVVYGYCKKEGIDQGEKHRRHNDLLPQIEAIKKDVFDGLTRQELALKYRVRKGTMDAFLREHQISTKIKSRPKLNMGSLKNRNWKGSI